MTYAEVILAAIPGAEHDVVEHILWGRTPYPMGRVTARSLYKAASGWRRACANGIALCDHCERHAVTRFECQFCHDVLHQARAA